MAKVNRIPSPFVKWAGGKRQLLGHIRELMPEHFNNYIEPFVGGGAVFWDVHPQKAIINDINRELIITYKWLKNNPDMVMEYLDEYDRRISEDNMDLSQAKKLYYEVRERYNAKLVMASDDADMAALFIFLNKHCFNGLYRCNSKGLFNVPFSKSQRVSYEKDNLLSISKALQTTTIKNIDFEDVCNEAQAGDFVFLDSPYAPVKVDSFVDYTKEGFSYKDHIRLADQFKKMSSRGCFCILTNHNTQFINDLYDGYNKFVVQVKRLINRDAQNRVGEEIIITNF
ncbi:Dam family site-specific DNA-(adenine-N6)-methyltransferase [Anaerovibrio sp.]|uniref:DNA adenine methylase n=1 Tax=Anaerovibrio sp. TaxID=1872532 RepID=UPI0025BB2E57|nr:Dam family site-specific DNA-(adenine-N6)-methyltransferase [Anaerovibrio sp.]